MRTLKPRHRVTPRDGVTQYRPEVADDDMAREQALERSCQARLGGKDQINPTWLLVRGFSIRGVCVYQSHVSEFCGYNTRHLRFQYMHATLSHSRV